MLSDRPVKLVRAAIVLASFAALGVVLFGRDDTLAISFLVAVGVAWLLHSKI
jgi:hypothetical protein